MYIKNIEFVYDPCELFEKTLEKAYYFNPLTIGIHEGLKIDSKNELKKYKTKINVPEKIKDTIIEDLKKYNIEINYKYFNNIVLDNTDEYDGFYNKLNDLIIINKNNKNKICTLEHEIIHKYIEKNFSNKKLYSKYIADVLSNKIFRKVKNILPFYDKENEDLKFSGSAFNRFDELSANFISTKNYAERLKKRTYTWKLNEFDKETIKLLDKLEPINYALVELAARKAEFYEKENGINIFPRNRINQKFIEELEKTNDLPKTFEKFGEKYFPDLLKD